MKPNNAGSLSQINNSPNIENYAESILSTYKTQTPLKYRAKLKPVTYRNCQMNQVLRADQNTMFKSQNTMSRMSQESFDKIENKQIMRPNFLKHYNT